MSEIKTLLKELFTLTNQEEGENNPLEIESLEKKDDGTFIVKIRSTEIDLDQEFIEYLILTYGANYQSLKSQYESLLKEKDKEIEEYRTKLEEARNLNKKLASQPIKITLSNSIDDSE